MVIDEKESKTSVYNEAMFQTQRLHALWEQCHYYSRRGNLYDYRWVLERIWVELASDALDLDTENIKNNKWYRKIELLDRYIAEAQKKNANLYYEFLKKKEMLLKRLLEQAGKGSVKRDISRYGMDL